MKKIDKLLLTSFIGPFAVSFGIALFVLIMQFMWVYIDDIAGKGVGIFIMMELIGYLSISTFPMALPVAVLIASVMVMGNLAERYELSSMKSAGVPLIRIMRGLIIWAAVTSVFSYVCSDIIIPVSNLKFKSRLRDIQKQKPALALEKGIFNEDFKNFVIRIGDKASDGETISDVMIDEQANLGKMKFNQILADSGRMFTTDDRRFFVMNLYKGTQYQEPGGAAGGSQQQKYPFIRTQFQSWTKVWDLKEFDLVRTDEDRWSAQRAMLSMSQLRYNMDSLSHEMQAGRQLAADDLLFNLKREPLKPKKAPMQDSVARQKNAVPEKLKKAKILDVAKKNVGLATATQDPPRRPKLPQQERSKPLGQHASFDQTFRAEDRPALLKEAHVRAKTSVTAVDARKSRVGNYNMEWVKTGYELFIKYSFAVVCLIFVFIGGPMGAIIRKGGFGYPILVSIIFFVTFIMLTILCKKLAESYIMSPFWAAMMPCLVLIPIGVSLTRKAMNDSQMFGTERLERFLRWVRQRFQKQKPVAAA